jgi:hypothetical protein
MIAPNKPAKSMIGVRRRIANLTDAEKDVLLEGVVRSLYCDRHGFNPDVEWSSGTAEQVAEWVNEFLKVKV